MTKLGCAAVLVGCAIGCSSGDSGSTAQDATEETPVEDSLVSDSTAEAAGDARIDARDDAGADATNEAEANVDVAPEVICGGADVTFTDVTFTASDWTSNGHLSTDCGGSGPATTSLVNMATGGDPDAYGQATLVLDSPTCVADATGYFYRTTATYAPAVKGAIGTIDVAFDVRAHSLGTVSIGLAAKQGTSDAILFVTPGTAAEWTHYQKMGIDPSALHVDGSPAGAPITFGFVLSFRTVGHATLVEDVDNWSVTVHPAVCP